LRPHDHHRRRHVENGGRTPACLEQLIVELVQQDALQRELGREADSRAHRRQQDHLGDQQPDPQ
jgi:hypothetical protein